MSKHTSGPWVVSKPTDQDYNADWEINGVGWRGLAVGFHNDSCPGEGGANARLIAKAPEMYELLHVLVRLDDLTHPDEARRARALLEELDS